MSKLAWGEQALNLVTSCLKVGLPEFCMRESLMLMFVVYWIVFCFLNVWFLVAVDCDLMVWVRMVFVLDGWY